MGTTNVDEPDAKKLILDLSSEDWATLGPVHKELKRNWGTALGLHRSAITFTPQLAGVVRVRLTQTRIGMSLLEPIWAFLKGLPIGSGQEANEILTHTLKAIFDLPASVFPDGPNWLDASLESAEEVLSTEAEGPASVENEIQPARPGKPSSEDAVADDAVSEGLTPAAVDVVREALKQLELSQPQLLAGLTRATEDVTHGAATAPTLAEDLSSWNALLLEVGSAIGRPASVPIIEQFVAAVDAADDNARADRNLIERVRLLEFPGAPEVALAHIQPLFDDAVSAPVPLDDSLRSLLECFVRVVTADAWEKDDDDLDRLAARYGVKFASVATRLTASSTPSDTASSPPPVAQEVETVGGNADVTEPLAPQTPLTTDVTPPRNTPASTDGTAMALFETTTPSPPEPEAVLEVAGVDEDIVTESTDGDEAIDPQPGDEAVDPHHADESTSPISAQSHEQSVPEVHVRVPREIKHHPAEQQHGVDGAPSTPIDCLARVEGALDRSDFALAYWYARAGNEERVAMASELLAVSTTMDPRDTNAQQRCRRLAAGLESALGDATPADIKTIAAAVVPAALMLAPYSEASSALNAARQKVGDDCPEFVSIIHELTYSRGAGISTMESKPAISAKEEARRDLVAFRSEARTRTTRFHRATEVWRELVRDQGELGSLMDRGLSDPEDDALRPALRHYSDPKVVNRLIEATDHYLNPIQAKKSRIIAGASRELRDLISRTLDLLTRYLDACDQLRALDDPAHRHLDLVEKVVPALRDEFTVRDLGDHLSRSVASWLSRRLEETSSRTSSAEETMRRPLVLASELVRQPNHSFDNDAVTLQLLDRLNERTLDEAFDGFATHDDHVGLGELMEWIHDEAPDELARFEERKREAEQRTRTRLGQRIDETRRSIATALSATALLSDAESQQMQTRLERIQDDTAPHFPDAMKELDEIIRGIEQKRETRLNQAGSALDGLNHASTEALDRVKGLLDRGDLMNAEEFIAQLSSGAVELPVEASLDSTFRDFWPDFSQEASEQARDELAWLNRMAREKAVAGHDLLIDNSSEILRTGFREWVNLSREQRNGDFQTRVRSVMMALGFQLEPRNCFERFGGGKFIAHTVMRASYEGHAVAPPFGSGAHGKYVVVLCWDRKSPKGLLDSAHEIAKGQPTVILYFHAISTQDRRILGELVRRDSHPYVVIDHASMAFIATRRDPSLERVMRISLPFSGVNPFTPFVLGDVPREMFYGRDAELRKVQDPAGPLFVYGGRQLGKSALLKTAMKDFQTRSAKNVSLYVDLKAQGVGEWRGADQVWRVLIEELQRLGILDHKTSKAASGDVVVQKVRTWLQDDPERHLLVLLDEADSFLDQDSRAPEPARFKNVYLLKSLMDVTSRRFKPVFAGLHQVQRFHKESNGPMAHVGTEIPIGPLPPGEAYKLVTRPLAAIGYEFTSPDAVWRLLNHTNYQASLIQLFCNALVERLQRRKLLKGQPPSPIDATLIDNVYAEKEVRISIAQRFEWTIQLDNRYRVIALTAAWLSLETDDSTYSVDHLREFCSSFWHDGFIDANWEDFRALLDEMVGLGVLVRAGDYYGIRSPNVIRLLGSPEEIARKLEDAKHLELASSYDASRYRRRLLDGVRSPLTEAQVARTLSTDGIVEVIVGTTALHADRVVDALTEIVGERRESGEDLAIRVAGAAELTAAITALSHESGRGHLHWDARAASLEDLRAGISRLVRQATQGTKLSCSCLITPHQAIALGESDGTLFARLGPWQDADLRAIEPEASFPLDRASREMLLHHTGGWFAILNRVFERRAGGGLVEDEIIECVATWRTEQTPAGFLKSSEIEPDSLEVSVLKVACDLGEPMSKADFADLLPEFKTAEVVTAIDLLALSGLLKADGSQGEAFVANPLASWALG